MGKVLNKQQHGFDVRIYTNDHSPIHVHVELAERNAVVYMDDYTVRENYGFKSREIKKIIALLKQHRNLIVAEWNRIHGA
jgi:hypothetical protein